MEFKLTMQTDNDAFEGGFRPHEIARILIELAGRIADMDEDGQQSGQLHDTNGSRVGAWSLS